MFENNWSNIILCTVINSLDITTARIPSIFSMCIAFQLLETHSKLFTFSSSLPKSQRESNMA